ncbi:MmcQ/YjbR family DNA-binding protein [Streptomyces olindensis]|uniref:MmcQ/YjbR family DNA-binding protein n=1 Tax=Streptomyces olindensis TaxID=358823 RepID=UPI0033C2B977
MTTVKRLREAALALPETQEGTHSGTESFSVRGKAFASLTEDGLVWLHLPPEETEAAPAAHPTGERLLHRGTPIGFRVPLADVAGKSLNALVRASWFRRAPQRLAASLAAAEAAADRPGGDLPAGIGRPATRALFGAGLTTLEQVAERSAGELLALHGVGPEAVRVVSEALRERGLDLRQ